MHRRSKRWTITGLLLSACLFAAAQQPVVDHDPVPSPDPDTNTSAPAGQTEKAPLSEIEKSGKVYTLRAEVGEVRLNAAVLEKGRPVQNVPADAFQVYEDGVLQKILSFRHEDLPVSLGILIDNSGSMYDKRTAVDKSALDLVRLSNPQDEAFLVDFSDEPYIDQDFTSDVNKLKAALSYVKPAGGTSIYDTVVASADYLAKNAKHPKQVLLLITDGDDNASGLTLEEAIRRVQDLDGPTIYCVGLLFGDDTNKSEARHARRVLETLAAQTGGIAYFPRKLSEVDDIAAEVANDIRQQYTITYRSTKPASLGGYRQIRVEAKAKGFGKLDVRTRTGYFPKGTSQNEKTRPANMEPGSKHPGE